MLKKVEQAAKQRQHGRSVQVSENGESAEESAALFRAKNAKRINDAVKLLRPEARDDVETALIEIEFMHGQLVSVLHDRTKPAKLAARNLAKALERVQRQLEDKDLPHQIGLFFPQDTIAEWLARCRGIATRRSGKHPRKKVELKRLVVREAATLMWKQMAGGRATHSLGGAHGNLVKLATILYGDPNTNLTSQCAAYLREPRKAK
ncbi:hypothetical protein SAMN05443247_06530 [Bradyrhizobium erythrophlei]|nr:hypothetical protein SAMN05443247_06530 [Bradyrhizobium erythrophlei]